MFSSGDPKIPQKKKKKLKMKLKRSASYVSLKRETTNHSTFNGKTKHWDFVYF